MNTCANCKHFDCQNDANLCRKFPPITKGAIGATGHGAIWPQVVPSKDWCGSYEPRG